MPFSKSFPKTTNKSVYPKWVEVALTEQEEKEQEKISRQENIQLLKECLDDARKLVQEKKLAPYQSDIVALAVALFEKRASHSIFWKESKAKEKFDAHQ